MLTKQQRRALLFIEAELERSGGVAPTAREIAEHLQHRSPTMAKRLLAGLEERGFIRRRTGYRAIEVVKPVSRFAAFCFDARAKALRQVSGR